jgi:flagellin-like hook-associated protein FlgL
MREELRLVLERFETALSVAGASVEQNARASGVALTDAAARAGGDFAAIAKKLAEAGDSAGTALRAGGADARLHMAEASRLLAESAAGLGGRLAAIAEATDGLAARAIELQEAARSATTPLQVTAQDLRQAAVATREAAAPLADAGATVRAAMDGLRQASDSVTAAYRQADALATSLGDASDRFKGVDQVIGKTTDELTKGVRELERQFGDFVRGMDKGLGDSLQQLAAIAEGLEESAKEIAGANKTSRVLP